MKRICKYCKRVLGIIRPLDDFSVKYEICAECERELNKEEKK